MRPWGRLVPLSRITALTLRPSIFCPAALDPFHRNRESTRKDTSVRPARDDNASMVIIFATDSYLADANCYVNLHHPWGWRLTARHGTERHGTEWQH